MDELGAGIWECGCGWPNPASAAWCDLCATVKGEVIIPDDYQNAWEYWFAGTERLQEQYPGIVLSLGVHPGQMTRAQIDSLLEGDVHRHLARFTPIKRRRRETVTTDERSD